MIVQINTDHNIEGKEKFTSTFTELITDELGHFSEHITRVEAHLADENGKKSGPDDIRCTLEARIEGRQPIAVTNHADTPYQAVSGATDKLRASLQTIFDKMKNH
jgi:ribosome-associated translation inhibitor RaiA